MKRATALMHRNLLDDNYRWGTYAIRMVVVIWAGALVAIASFASRWSTAPGRDLFIGLVSIDFWILAILSILLGASIITEEREERTLGLLLMTGMANSSLLLGKGVSRLLLLLSILLLQLPMYLLAVMLGGVLPAQIPAATLSLLAFLFFSLNLALFFSVYFRRTSTASVATGITLVLFVSITTYFGEAREVNWLGQQSPFLAVARINGFNFSGPIVGPQVIGNLLLGLGIFGLSVHIFPSCSQKTAEDPGRNTRLKKRSLFGSNNRIGRYGRPGRFPIFWKDFNTLGGGVRMWKIKTLLLVLICFGIPPLFGLFTRNQGGDEYVTVSLGFLISACCTGAGIEYIYNTATVFRKEFDSNTLSSLALLPGSFRKRLWAKFLGTQCSLVPYMVLAGAGSILMAIIHYVPSPFRPPSANGWDLDAVYLFLVFSAICFGAFLLGTAGLARVSLHSKWMPLPFLFLYGTGILFTLMLAGLVTGGEKAGLYFIFTIYAVCINSIAVKAYQRLVEHLWTLAGGSNT